MSLPAAPTLAAVVRERTGLAWSRAKALCSDGRVTVDGERVRDPAARVGADAVVVIDAHGPKVKKESVLTPAALVHVDRDVVIVDKPAGLLSVADEEGNRDTLVDRVRMVLRRTHGRDADGPLGVVHRLDRDTSGLIVFTRNAAALRALGAQFREHEIDRLYHAIVHGHIAAQRVETMLLPDRGDGLRGSFGLFRRAKGEPPPTARSAVTHLQPLEPLEEAMLVACRLETGRQHQIRIHLAELGHPLLGERVYIRDFKGAVIDAPRVMLHARTLGFVHPRSGEAVRFEREAPEDFTAMVAALRA